MLRQGLAISAALSACGGSPAPAVDAAQAQVDAVVPAGLSFAGSWGGYGTEPGRFVEPSSVELDRAGFVWVAGHEDRIQKFTGDGELVDIIGSSGTGDGEFDHPHGLAIARAGEELVYVGDQENGRVQVFTTEGAFVRLWTDDQFAHIHDVGIDPESGDLFVGDYELDVLQRFTASGELVWERGGPGTGPGQFDGIWGISTDSAGNVYAADSRNRRVQKLDPAGGYLGEWSGDGSREFEKPTGLYVAEDGIVYVCDSLRDQVLLFTGEGAFIESWNLAAVVGDASEPEDIVLDPTGTQIYLGEVRNHRVLHLERTP